MVSWSRALSILLLSLAGISAVASLAVPWYVVSSPEVEGRWGLEILFYVDRFATFSIDNGTTYPTSFGSSYWVDEVFGPVRDTFIGAILAGVLVTVFSGTGAILIARRASPRLVARVSSVAAAMGWLGTAHFAWSFPLAVWTVNEGDWPLGFYDSVYIEWAPVTQTYGPGAGWFFLMLAAALATAWAVVSWLVLRRSRRGETSEASQPEPDTPRAEP